MDGCDGVRVGVRGGWVRWGLCGSGGGVDRCDEVCVGGGG